MHALVVTLVSLFYAYSSVLDSPYLLHLLHELCYAGSLSYGRLQRARALVLVSVSAVEEALHEAMPNMQAWRVRVEDRGRGICWGQGSVGAGFGAGTHTTCD